MLKFDNENGHGVVSPGAEGLHVPPRASVVSEVVGLLQPQAVQVEPRLVTVPAVLVRLRGNMLDVTATLAVTLSVSLSHFCVRVKGIGIYWQLK